MLPLADGETENCPGEHIRTACDELTSAHGSCPGY